MIGSGPAGLAMLRALSKLKHGAVDFACYDRQPAAGGMWTGDRRFSPMLVIIAKRKNNCHLFNGFWVSFLFSIIYSCWCFDGDVATLYRYDGMWINGAAYYTEYPS